MNAVYLPEEYIILTDRVLKSRAFLPYLKHSYA